MAGFPIDLYQRIEEIWQRHRMKVRVRGRHHVYGGGWIIIEIRTWLCEPTPVVLDPERRQDPDPQQ